MRAPARQVAGASALAVLLLSAAGVLAQEESRSAYAGLESRSIKALSAERVAGLRAGAGLGYAMAAELNGHAGPKHVLELAAELGLSAEQRVAIEAVFDRMRTVAVPIGTEIVDAEAMLDRRFSHRHLDEKALEELTSRIGQLEGRLRFVHLRAHLETDGLLDAEQRARYVELRGYGSDEQEREGEHGHAH